MRTLTSVVALTAIATVAVTPAAFAQADRTAPSRTPSGATQRDTMQRDTKDMPRETWRNQEGEVEAKRLIGTKIRGADNKDLGEIDQLLVDPRTGKVNHVVVGLGGVLGVGEKHVVVPWSAVKLTADPNNRDRMVVTMEQAMLEKAPRYERREARETVPSASPSTPRTTDEKRPATTK